MIKKALFIFLLLLSIHISRAQPVNTNISNGVAFDGEPYLAMNPTNNKNLVAAWMDLKFVNGGFHIEIKTRASLNGGDTWSTGNALPHFSNSYGSADVSMAFNKGGLLYLCYIDYRKSPDSGGIYVARSFDGGLNWDTPSKAFDVYDVANKRPIDRPWLMVDKSNTKNSGTLYITTKPAPWISLPNRNYFKVSSDSGRTWSPIGNVDGGTHLVGNLIAAPMATPSTTVNGRFCAVYPSYVTTQNSLPAFYLAASGDKGQTFSYTTVLAASPAANDTNLKNGYLLLTHPADSNKMVFLLPSAANGDDDIFAIQTNNAGVTWNNPVRVNDDGVANGKDQDLVWGAYNKEGSLALTWRDRRDAPANGFWHAGYDFYYALSKDNGQTFSANNKLSSQFIAFDSAIAKNGNDFMSCVYREDTLYTVWGDTRNSKMNIYFAKTIASSNTTTQVTLLEGENPIWNISPNPATNELTISAPKEMMGKEVSVFDVTGKRVLKKYVTDENLKLDVRSYTQGIYFVKIGNDVERFVKE